MGKLLFLFIVVPAIEIALLIQVGGYLGTMPTLGLIVATGMLGAYLARRQGLSVLTRAHEEMNRGQIPAGPLADGVMILVAGAVLLTPGILTDVMGFLLLVPAVRAKVKAFLLARFRRAVDENRVYVNVEGVRFEEEAGPVIDVQPDPFDEYGSDSGEPSKYKVH